MFKFLLSLVVYFSFIFISFADHGPKKMWKRQIVPYFDVHETKTADDTNGCSSSIINI